MQYICLVDLILLGNKIPSPDDHCHGNLQARMGKIRLACLSTIAETNPFYWKIKFKSRESQ